MENNKNEMVITKSLVIALVIPVIHKMKIEFPAYSEQIKIINNIAEDDSFKANLGNDINVSFSKWHNSNDWKCVSNHGFCYIDIFHYGAKMFSMPSCKTCPEMIGSDIIRLRWFFTELIKRVNEWITDTRFPHDKWAIGINGSPNITTDENGHFVINSNTVTQTIDETTLNSKTLNDYNIHELGTECENTIRSIDDVNKLIRDWLRLKYGKDIKIVSTIIGSESIRVQVGPFKSQRVIIVDTNGYSYRIYNTMRDLDHHSIKIFKRICAQQFYALQLCINTKYDDFSEDEMHELAEYINNTISSNNNIENKGVDNNMKDKKTFDDIEKSCEAKIRQFIGDRVINFVENFIDANCVWNHLRYSTPKHNEYWWIIKGAHRRRCEFGFEFLESPDMLCFYMRNIWGEKINYFTWEYPGRIINTPSHHPLENGSLMGDLFEYIKQLMMKANIKSEYIRFLSSANPGQEIINHTIKSVLGSNPVIEIDECNDTIDHNIPKKEHDEPSEEEIQRVIDKLCPLCVIKDRYDGKYSGGKYTAWACGLDNIPSGIDGVPSEIFEDESALCAATWDAIKKIDQKGKFVYGVGETPDEALRDLAKTIIRISKKD